MKEVYTPHDFNKNELKQAVVENLSASPSSPAPGQLYFDTDTAIVYFWNGGAWIAAGSGGGGAVTSVNGQTGAVSLTQDDVGDGTTYKRYSATDKTKLAGIEALADVTDATNVEAAGALMDSEVDADIKTLSLPANVTISAFAATLLDDAAASNARTTLGLVIGTDVEAHDADLTTIAGLTPTNDDVLQRKAGAWINRTPAQLKTDLALTKTDVGLSNVTNVAQLAASALDVDGTLAANSDLKVASQKATKTYVDAAVAGVSAPVTSVNGATGVVVLTQDNVADGTTYKQYSATDKSKLAGIEALADVTDATNVAAAGALMASSVDTDITTLVLPANTTISTFMKGLLDDTTLSGALTTLGLDTDLATLSLPASVTISAFAATLLDDTTAAAVVATLGFDADILTLALPASTTISAFGASLIDDANAAAAIATLGLDADIATLSLPASVTISAFGKTLVDDADASTARTTLGVGIGSDVQAFDAFLQDIADLTDPNADRIPFWDDSAGHIVWLTIGTGLSITGTQIDASGGGGGAPSNATYITQTADGTLSNEQALGALATGIVKNTTTTGVLSIATAGTDYTSPSSTEAMTNKTLTTPKFADLGYIADANGNEMLVFDTVTSAVPYIRMFNDVTGGVVGMAADGETNQHIQMSGKGNGLTKCSVLRQDNTTNAYKHNTVQLTGWGVFAQGAAGNKSETVTFGITFAAIPIVLIAFGGDQTGGSIALGNGGNIEKGPVAVKAYGESTTAFTAHAHTSDGTSWSATANVYYKWVAFGEL